MKKKSIKNTKKVFSQSKARTHQRKKNKSAARDELMRIVEEINVSASSAVFRESYDGGRRARVTHRPGAAERVVRGIFHGSSSGFGFVTPEDGYENLPERDIFIPEDKTQGAIDGDTVEIIFHAYTTRFGDEKTEGRVRRIISVGRKTVIGVLTEKTSDFRYSRYRQKRYVVIPDDKKFSWDLVPSDLSDAQPGDKVEVLLERNGGTREISCKVIKCFGPAESRGANYQAILSENGIIDEFTKEELCEAEFMASIPVLGEGRVIRRETILTIDGAGAKDLDDAVSLRRLKDGWQLGVHIADVSHYVKERTHLDRCAMARGTSVYFTDKVVPMLPPALSNRACSLNPGEDKYTLSAIINLNSLGDILSVKLEPSVIRSKVRGVYSEVNAIFEGTADSEIKKKYRPVLQTLEKMHELYLILKAKSERRGSMELEDKEAEIILDESGEPCDIVRRERGDAEKLIEQFMITANEAVAKYLSDKGLPCVYRVHEKPPADKLSGFLTYAHNLGLKISGVSKDDPTPGALGGILGQAREAGLETQVSYALLRSMSKARYSEERSGHFGLGLEYYAHFTSPIRRLSDLATHRIIHRVLLEEKNPSIYEKYAKRAAAAATEAELRALTAEREIENLYKVLYMMDKIGSSFDAVISSVTSFGFFAELDNTCEGLVPLSDLRGVFTFDEKNMSLRSRDVIYRIGDKVSVTLEECDISRGKLRFSLND